MWQRSLSVGSGGGSNVVTGEVAGTITASSTITIDTGLSEVKKFTLVGWLVMSTNALSAQCLEFDKDYSSNTFSSFEISAPTTASSTVTGYGATTLSFGAATTASFSISSISGGIVTLTAPSATQFSTSAKSFHLYWYAE